MILEGFDQDFYERALRREGVEEGRAENRDEMILGLLAEGVANSIIAKAAKVSVEYVEELKRKAS